MPRQTKKQKEEELPFESLMKQIEEMVVRLEEGELSLEDSLLHYEKGVGLVRRAQERLDQFDRRLEQLTADGQLVSMADDVDED